MITQFPHGLTVKQLKDLIKDWPEVDEMGDPCEVWLGTLNGYSNICTEVSSLNLCSFTDGTVAKESADLLLGFAEK
jgi:DNA polymerase sigma